MSATSEFKNVRDSNVKQILHLWHMDNWHCCKSGNIQVVLLGAKIYKIHSHWGQQRFNGCITFDRINYVKLLDLDSTNKTDHGHGHADMHCLTKSFHIIRQNILSTENKNEIITITELIMYNIFPFHSFLRHGKKGESRELSNHTFTLVFQNLHSFSKEHIRG